MRPGALGSAGSIGGYRGPNPDGPFAPSLSLVVVTSRLGSRKEGRVREPISDIPAISSWYTSGPGSSVARSTTTERLGDEATTMVPGGLPSILGGSRFLGLSLGPPWAGRRVTSSIRPSARPAKITRVGGRVGCPVIALSRKWFRQIRHIGPTVSPLEPPRWAVGMGAVNGALRGHPRLRHAPRRTSI